MANDQYENNGDMDGTAEVFERDLYLVAQQYPEIVAEEGNLVRKHYMKAGYKRICQKLMIFGGKADV